MTIQTLLAIALWCAPTQAASDLDEPGIRLVVAPFDEHGTMPGLGSAVADLLIRAVDREDIALQERGQFRRVVEERRLAETDLVNRARELGQIEEARLVLVGSVYRLDDRYLLSARIVDLAARIQDGQRGWVIVRTIDDLAGAVELLAVQLGLRAAGAEVPADLLLRSSPPPPPSPPPGSEGGGEPRVSDLVGAVAPANPFELRMRLEPDAQVLAVGDPVRVRVETRKDGWLTLLAIDSRGMVTPLVPNRRVESLAVRAGTPRIVPDELGFMLRAALPAGATRLRAIVTEKPIDLGRLRGEGATGVGLALDPSTGLPPATLAGLGGTWSTAEVEFAVRDGSSSSTTSAVPAAASKDAGVEPVTPGASPGEPGGDARPTEPARLPSGSSQGSSPSGGEPMVMMSRSPAALGMRIAEVPADAPLPAEAWHLACDPHAIGWTPEHAALRPPLLAVVDAGFDFRDQRLADAWLRDPSGEVLSIDLIGADRDADGVSEVGRAAGHGHAVASLIAARRLPTSPAVQGVVPLATLVPITIASREEGPAWRTPRGDASTVLQALRTALDLGARVVNLSLGIPVTREELARLSEDPVWDRLEDAQVVVVCAAGNDGRDLDEVPVFPASVDRPNVLAVAASDPQGDLAEEEGRFRSGRGRGRVGLAAPGVRLPAAGVRGRTELVDGTSYAAALASGAAAAILAMDPSLTAAQVVERLRSEATAAPVGESIGGGVLRLPSIPTR